MDPKEAVLTPPNTNRWTVRREAAIVAAVRAGGDHSRAAAVISFRRKSFSLGSWRLKPMAFEVYSPHALSITVGWVRRGP